MTKLAPKVAKKEIIEDTDSIDKKAKELANLIKSSKHFIIFTGAGISTSAGIPDFRGPEGAWTLLAQGRERTGKTTDTLQAIPTPTHMSIVELLNRGILKFVISQNCDGLHRKSGIASDKISELHGNSNREYCKDCGKEYIRDFWAVAKDHKPIEDHRTGRKCHCGSSLHDTIIHFGEDLPAEAFDLAHNHAAKTDLCLVLGSSLTVTPANEIPEIVGENKSAKLVICNLQDTPLDSIAEVRVFSKTDDLMERVMRELGIEIPAFILTRRLVVEVQEIEGRVKINVLGVDEDGTPVSFLRSVKLLHNRRLLKSEPFLFHVRDELESGQELEFELQFMGHYGEPNLVVGFRNVPRKEKWFFRLGYDPVTGVWEIESEE